MSKPITPEFNKAADKKQAKMAAPPKPAPRPAGGPPGPGGARPMPSKTDIMKGQSKFLSPDPRLAPAPKSPVLTTADVRAGKKGVLKNEFDKRK
jgi:hypothetical protein